MVFIILLHFQVFPEQIWKTISKNYFYLHFCKTYFSPTFILFNLLRSNTFLFHEKCSDEFQTLVTRILIYSHNM